jgi:TRAP-type mannitol/chloroaromatic compound transport system permease small subunit
MYIKDFREGDMRNIFKCVDWLSEWSGTAFSYTIYAGIAILCYEVFMRYVLSAPTLWAHGMIQRIFAIYYLIAGAYVLLHEGHINMDLLHERLSARTRAIFDVITSAFIIGTAVVLFWYGGKFALKSIMNLECCNSAWQAPVYPIKAIFPISGALLLLQTLTKLMKDIYTVVTGRRYEY